MLASVHGYHSRIYKVPDLPPLPVKNPRRTPGHEALDVMPAVEMQCAVRALATATGHSHDEVLARLVQQNGQLLPAQRMNANGFEMAAIQLYLQTY
jgi:hypothetical protein